MIYGVKPRPADDGSHQIRNEFGYREKNRIDVTDL